MPCPHGCVCQVFVKPARYTSFATSTPVSGSLSSGMNSRWALIAGSGAGLQTVEVGAQTYRDLYGDWNPHLFIFYTTNGYTQSGNVTTHLRVTSG